MKERRLDVMLSSTSKDLPDHRAKAEDSAKRAGFFPVVMETLPALPQNEDAITVSMAMVEQAEVYLGIFGLRYGYRPADPRNPNDISITEMEYRRAKELGMPILIFIMADDHPAPDTGGMKAADARKITDAFYERDPRGEEKLDLLKKELLSNHILAQFVSPEDLGTKVLQALHTPSLREAARAYQQKRDDETGDDNGSPRAVAPKTTIPYPPKLYAYPPYSGQNAVFVGRRAELDLLDDWAAPKSGNPLLVLEAVGGMGKSALTWRWVQDNAVPFDGVFWYSFYEGGALMSECLRHALAYVTRRDPDALRDLPFARVLAELVTALKSGRYLLVLDGLERVLVAYHRWNAAQMQDDAVEEGADYRACTDPRDADALRQLTDCAPSRVLITSRLMPAALSDAGDELAGVRHEVLQGLSPADARKLWHAAGIAWTDEGRLDGFINQFGRHSLLLKLMIDIIKKNRSAKNSFDRWYEIHGASFDLFAELKAKRHHILQFAYEGLSTEARKLLSQMAALGSALDIDTLNVFNPYLNSSDPVLEPIKPRKNPFISEEQNTEREAKYEREKAAYDAYLKVKAKYEKSAEFKRAIARFDSLLRDLEMRSLIWWDEVNLQYDLHPVVRGYAFSQLGEEDRPATYDRIYNFFEAQERGKYETQFATFAAMQNLIAMYNALLGAGKFDAAAQLFRDRMKNNLVFGGLGLYNKAYELLLPLFPNGLGEIPAVSTVDLQSDILNAMEVVLTYSGRAEQALMVTAAELKVSFERGTYFVAIALQNYGNCLRVQNRLVQALRCYHCALTLSELSADKENITDSHSCLMAIHLDLGRWDEARIAYEYFVENPSNNDFLLDAHREFCEGLIWQGIDRATIEELLRKAEGINLQLSDIRRQRLLLQTRGQLALREGQLDEAVHYFAEAARIGNEQGLRDYGAWSGLAQAYVAKGDLKNALRIVRDGVGDDVAAVVHLANGDHAAALEAALEYYTGAWAQGEPYVRRWHLEQARDLLRQLNEPEPQLPVWDESKYEPFEHEDKVIELIERLKREKAEREAAESASDDDALDELFFDSDDDFDFDSTDSDD